VFLFVVMLALLATVPSVAPSKAHFGPTLAQRCAHPTPDFQQRLKRLRAKGIRLCVNPQQASPRRVVVMRPHVAARKRVAGKVILQHHPVLTVTQILARESARHLMSLARFRYNGTIRPGFNQGNPTIAGPPTPNVLSVDYVNVVPGQPITLGPGGPGFALFIVGPNLAISGKQPSILLQFSTPNATCATPLAISQVSGDGSAVMALLPQLVYGAWRPNASGQLIISNGLAQTSLPISYTPVMYTITVDTYVTPDPSFDPGGQFVTASDGATADVGLGPSNARFASDGNRSGTFFGGKDNDVLGVNAALVNGYTVQNTFVEGAWSDSDSSSALTAPNSDRGARVEVAASGGSLQSTFHWWYEAGDSVAYGAAWQLYGPYGVRPVSTMQKQTTSICES